MRPNRKNFDLRICTQSISMGVTREINYAKTLRRELFESDAEFLKYYGVNPDGPAAKVLFATTQPEQSQ